MNEKNFYKNYWLDEFKKKLWLSENMETIF